MFGLETRELWGEKNVKNLVGFCNLLGPHVCSLWKLFVWPLAVRLDRPARNVELQLMQCSSLSPHIGGSGLDKNMHTRNLSVVFVSFTACIFFNSYKRGNIYSSLGYMELIKHTTCFPVVQKYSVIRIFFLVKIDV